MDTPRTAYLRQTVIFFSYNQQGAFESRTATGCGKSLNNISFKLNNGSAVHCGACGES